MINISSEVYFFLYAIICGLFTGTIYDLFRIKRLVFKSSKTVILIDDIVFWIIMGTIFILVSHNIYNGELRLYLLLGLAIGIVLYILLFSKQIVKFGVKLTKITLIPFELILKISSKVKRKCDIIYRRNIKHRFNNTEQNFKQ